MTLLSEVGLPAGPRRIDDSYRTSSGQNLWIHQIGLRIAEEYIVGSPLSVHKQRPYRLDELVDQPQVLRDDVRRAVHVLDEREGPVNGALKWKGGTPLMLITGTRRLFASGTKTRTKF